MLYAMYSKASRQMTEFAMQIVISDIRDKLREKRREGFAMVGKATVRVYDMNGDDFIKDMVTIVAEAELIRAQRITLKNSRHNRKLGKFLRRR